MVFKPTGRQANHLDLMSKYLEEEDDPGLAVCRYIKTILPRMDNRNVLDMTAFLIGTTSGMIKKQLRDDSLDVTRLASAIVACVLPAGADLGMESGVVGTPPKPDDDTKPRLSLPDWFDESGAAMALLSEHREGLFRPSLVLLTTRPDEIEQTARDVRGIDRKVDSRTGAWSYRRIKLQLVED
jgi:hypothetical protein